MENQTVTSPKWSLNTKDFLRGLLMAVLSSPFTFLLDSLNQGDWNLDWKKIGGVALVAGLTYLAKNLGTPATIQIPVPDSVAKNSDDPKAAK
jgi:hypothetical protein